MDHKYTVDDFEVWQADSFAGMVEFTLLNKTVVKVTYETNADLFGEWSTKNVTAESLYTGDDELTFLRLTNQWDIQPLSDSAIIRRWSDWNEQNLADEQIEVLSNMVRSRRAEVAIDTLVEFTEARDKGNVLS